MLGMHRSGTSALTGALGKLGVELGEELLEPTAENPKGYFENAQVVLAQERLFEALAHPWHDPRALPDGWAKSDAARSTRDILVDVVDELFVSNKTNADTNMVAVKDPRSCRVVPLWLDVASRVQAQPVAILMVRHPNEVAASLQRRDTLSLTRSHLLWIRYLLDAERATRGMPRAFVTYEALLEDWRRETGRIGRALGLSLAPTAAAGGMEDFLDTSLRNHTASPVAGEEAPLESLAVELYELALRCTAESARQASTEFDAIEAQFGTLARQYFDAIDDGVAIELPLQLQYELKRQGRDKLRIDMALQLAALRELWRPATIARAPGACKLYYRQHDTHFIESRSLSSDPVPLDNGLKATFELPAGSRVDHFRIDPDDAPGVFAIRSLSVDGALIVDLADRVTMVSELELPSATSTAVVRIAALGEDPYFELDMRGSAQIVESDRPLLVELSYHPETVASELSSQMHDVGLGLRHAYATVREQFEALQRQLIGIDDRAKTFHAESTELSGAIAELGAALAAAHDAQRGRDEATRAAITMAGREESANLSQAIADNLGSTIALVERIQAEAALRHDSLAIQLESVREYQATLLHWAQRRSPRYWWNRLLGKRGQDGTET